MVLLDLVQIPRPAAGQTELTARQGCLAKESNMEMFRNMEVVLMFCFGLIVTAAMLSQPSPSEKPLRAEGNIAAQMPVVVVTGKRLSAAEKAQAAQDAG
jgi:hypothetical protein